MHVLENNFIAVFLIVIACILSGIIIGSDVSLARLFSYPNGNEGFVYAYQNLIAGSGALLGGMFVLIPAYLQIRDAQRKNWIQEFSSCLSGLTSHSKSLLALYEWSCAFTKNLNLLTTRESYFLEKTHDIRKIIEERILKKDDFVFRIKLLLDASDSLHIQFNQELDNWFKKSVELENKISQEYGPKKPSQLDVEFNKIENTLLNTAKRIIESR